MKRVWNVLKKIITKIKFKFFCWKLKRLYNNNYNKNKPIFINTKDFKNRGIGKTTLVFNDALKTGFPIIVETKVQALRLIQKYNQLPLNKKRKFKPIKVYSVSDELEGKFVSKDKILLDCGLKGYLRVKSLNINIYNGFISYYIKE